MKPESRDKVLKHLGAARLEPYLAEAGGNKKAALNLYRWSVQLTASVQQLLGLTEVMLRNSIDEQLQLWNNEARAQETSWLLDEPANPLRSLVEDKRKRAHHDAEKALTIRPPGHPRHGDELTHDDVLAHTMFGMWKDLLPNHAPNMSQEDQRNQNRLRMWNESLSAAFPHAEDPDGKKTYWRVAHLHLLRNRVSHMDSLLNVDVDDRANDAFDLVGSIDPVLRNWLTGTSTGSQILNHKPEVR